MAKSVSALYINLLLVKINGSTENNTQETIFDKLNLNMVKNAPFRRRHTGRQFAVKDHLAIIS